MLIKIVDVNVSSGQYKVSGASPLLNTVSLCSPFSLSGTNTAQQNTASCTMQAYAGATVSINNCPSAGGLCSGDTFIRLFVGSVQVAENDDAPNSACFTCSSLTYTLPNDVTNSIVEFTLVQSCFNFVSW